MELCLRWCASEEAMLIIVLIVIITVVLLLGMDQVSKRPMADTGKRPMLDSCTGFYTVGLSATRNRSLDTKGFPRVTPHLRPKSPVLSSGHLKCRFAGRDSTFVVYFRLLSSSA